MLRACEEIALEHASGKFSSHFPGESRDPFPRHWELLKLSQYLAREDRSCRGTMGSGFAGEDKLKMDDAFTLSEERRQARLEART